MARYQDDFEQWGTRPVLPNPGAHGMDPNFRGGGYQGERMRASQPGQAPYGRYRQWSANDLGGFGGLEGRYGGYDQPYRPERQGGRTPPRYTGQYESGYAGYGEEPPRSYDRDVRRLQRGGYDREQRQGTGGGGGLRGDTGYLRDFNKNSPALGGDEGRWGQTRRGSGFADDSPDPRRWRFGGLRGDTGYLRDFNKNSPALRGDEGRRGQTRRGAGFADDSPDPRRWRFGGSDRYDEEHNRYGGYSSAGFAEYWVPKQAPRGTPMPHRK